MITASTNRILPFGLLCIVAALALTGCAPKQWRAIVTNATGQTVQVDLSQARMRLPAGQSLDLKDAQIKRLKANRDGAPTLRVQLSESSIKCYAMVFTSIPDDFLGGGSPRTVRLAITADGRVVAVRPGSKSVSDITDQNPALSEVACP